MRPWRLRDCRRWLAVGPPSARAVFWMGLPLNTMLGAVLDAVGAYCVYPGPEQARAIDRLISRFGPDALVRDVLRSLREQAERTDHHVGPDAEISDGPHTNPDSATHGGDGNSGEMDHIATAATEDRIGAGHDSASWGATVDTPDGRPTGHAAEHDAAADCGTSEQVGGSSHEEGQPTGQGDIGGDEPTGEMGTHQAADAVSAADTQTAGHGRSAQGAGAGGGLERNREEAGKRIGEAESPDAHRSSWGVPATALSYQDINTAARMARALSRLVSLATRPDPCPLWDGKRVVRELVSRQVRLHRMRQEVRVPRAVLVLYDVSGSCAWIAERTWHVASALATRYPAFLAAPTGEDGIMAEGSLDPGSIIGRGAIAAAARKLPPIIGWSGHGDDLAGWRRLRSIGVSHILVLGDAHGTVGYYAAAQAGIRVLWVSPNPGFTPDDAAWCDYILMRGTDIAAAVETLINDRSKT